MTSSQRIYRILVHFYPKAYREEYGALMEQAFRDLERDQQKADAAFGWLRLWLCVLPDAGASIVSMQVTHIGGRLMFMVNSQNLQFRRIIWGILAAAVILLGILFKTLLLREQGAVQLALLVSVGSCIAAVLLFGMMGRLGGWYIGAAMVVVLSLYVPLLWSDDPYRWLRQNPLTGWTVILLGFMYLTNPSRTAVLLAAGGLAAVNIFTSLLVSGL
jgi:hypothetical protein